MSKHNVYEEVEVIVRGPLPKEVLASIAEEIENSITDDNAGSPVIRRSREYQKNLTVIEEGLTTHPVFLTIQQSKP